MLKQIVWTTVLICMLSASPVAAEEDRIGSVRTLTGEVLIVRQGQPLIASVGTFLQRRDVVQTGPDSTVGLIFEDNTSLALGPSSRLDLEHYEFEPRHNRFGLLMKMMQGTFVYLSGIIGQQAPESIRLETPDSTIAIRGTRVLVEVAGNR